MTNEKDSKASATNVSSLYPSLDQDAALLARLGYKQGEILQLQHERSDPLTWLLIDALEFRRNFTPLEVFGVGFSIIGVVPSLA